MVWRLQLLLVLDQISVCRKRCKFSSRFFSHNICMFGIGLMDQATSRWCSLHLTRRCHPHVKPLLGSYKYRIHNFDLTLLKFLKYCTYLFFLQMYSQIKKWKKRVCPKRTIKGQKETKIKRILNMNPIKNRSWKCCKFKCHYFRLIFVNKIVCSLS